MKLYFVFAQPQAVILLARHGLYDPCSGLQAEGWIMPFDLVLYEKLCSAPWLVLVRNGCQRETWSHGADQKTWYFCRRDFMLTLYH